MPGWVDPYVEGGEPWFGLEKQLKALAKAQYMAGLPP